MTSKRIGRCLICNEKSQTIHSDFCIKHTDTQREISGGLAIILAKNNNVIPEFESFKKFLSERELLLLNNRFENKIPLSQVGKIFGISKERVRQIEYKLAKKYVKYLDASKTIS